MFRPRLLPLVVLLALVLATVTRQCVAANFVRGDVDGNGKIEIGDAVSITGYLFTGTPKTLGCLDAADPGDTGQVSISSAVYLLEFLFLGGPPPASPYPSCGQDPTLDDLTCERFDRCSLPPTVTIKAPLPGATLYVGIPYVFESESFDPDAFQALDCGSLTWTSNKAGDPFPKTGCGPTVTFATTGARIIALKGVNPEGVQASDKVAINVVDPPVNSPPVVTILNPANGALLQPNTLIILKAKATDPDGSPTISYEWILIRSNGTTKTLGTTTSPNGGQTMLPWIPKNDIPFDCGGQSARLRVRATDQDGQIGSKTIDIEISFPPC
jgi:hypothetical protein